MAGGGPTTEFLARPGGDIDAQANFHDLYNGNISAWSQSLPIEYHWGADYWDATGDNLTFVYRYDQLNRLKHAHASDLLDGSNDWGSIAKNLPPQLYRSDYWYDANGNITEAWRWDQFGTMYDKLEYQYHTVNGRKRTNRLYHLFDPSAAGVVDPADPLDQGVADIDVPGNPTFNNDPLTVNNGGNNYRYDPLGNLVQDTREQIGSIEWTVAGKVKKVVRTNGSPLPPLEFGYGADGQRIWKENLQSGETTYYIRDAQGNVMATYEAQSLTSSLRLTERPIYGSDRLGMDLTPMNLYGLASLSLNGTVPSNGPAGYRRFELKDHLGNVTVTTTGDRYGVDQVPQDGLIDYSVPKIAGWAGYEAFGSLLPGRNYSSGSYRFGFQGQEKDDEIHGAAGTSLAFEYRMHDSRVGRFLSIDPLAAKYAYNSPYAFSENRVIDSGELEGLERYFAADGKFIGQYGSSTQIRVVDQKETIRASIAFSPGFEGVATEDYFCRLEREYSHTPFKTNDEAAKSWAVRYNGESIENNREYASNLYEISIEGTTYVNYTDAIQGPVAGVNPSKTPIPSNAKHTGVIHAHGAYDDRYASNRFSGTPGDISYFEGCAIDGYVCTPNGSLQKYDVTKNEVTILSKDIPSDCSDPDRLNEIDWESE